jgi:hypothetical protein
MPGRWNPAAPPRRPGAYTNFVSRPIERINPPLSGIVALPITADWGPIDEVVVCDSHGDYRAIFGDSLDTPGNIAVYQAFKGEGIKNRGGASQVLAVREAGSSASASSAELADTDGTPDTDAVVLTAVYKGTKGNDISYAVVANVDNPSTEYDLVIYLQGSEVERWTYTKATNSTLTDIVRSDWVGVRVNSSRAALDVTRSPVALSGGDDGLTLTSGEWTAALTKLGTKRFGVFVPYDLSDDSLQAAIETWAADPDTGLNNKGKRFEVVMGGGRIGTPDTLSDALRRSAGYDNENIVNLGAFSVQDSKILDANGDPVELTAASFAPRVAGVIAATGDSAAVTFARFVDVTLLTGLSEDSDFVAASEGGVMTLAEDSNALAPVRIEQDVTSYISDTADKAKEHFGKLKFVRAMQLFEMAITEFSENEDVIGKLSNSAETREYIVGRVYRIAEEFEDRKAFLPKTTRIFVSQDPPPSDLDNFVNLLYDVTPARDVGQMRGTVVVT